jgi:hypothetical protein
MEEVTDCQRSNSPTLSTGENEEQESFPAFVRQLTDVAFVSRQKNRI